MSKSLLASYLVLAVLIFAIQPQIGRAQSHSQPSPPVHAQPLDPQIDAKADLKRVFAPKVRQIREANLTGSDLKRIETDSQTPQPQNVFTRKQKLFLALWIVCMTGLIVVLIKHPCKAKDPRDCEFIDDSYQY